MTDSELIKALENSTNTYNEKGVYVDKENLQQQVLDLLKRQKTEIERLKSMNQAKLDCIHNLQKENEILSRNADTAFQDGLNERRDLFAPEIKAEAYKEFASKVKQELMPCDLGAFSAVRAVLRDLTGEDTNDLQIL